MDKVSGGKVSVALWGTRRCPRGSVGSGSSDQVQVPIVHLERIEAERRFELLELGIEHGHELHCPDVGTPENFVRTDQLVAVGVLVLGTAVADEAVASADLPGVANGSTPIAGCPKGLAVATMHTAPDMRRTVAVQMAEQSAIDELLPKSVVFAGCYTKLGTCLGGADDCVAHALACFVVVLAQPKRTRLVETVDSSKIELFEPQLFPPNCKAGEPASRNIPLNKLLYHIL